MNPYNNYTPSAPCEIDTLTLRREIAQLQLDIKQLRYDVNQLYQLQLRMQTDVIITKNEVKKHDIKINNIGNGNIIKYNKPSLIDRIVATYIIPGIRLITLRLRYFSIPNIKKIMHI